MTRLTSSVEPVIIGVGKLNAGTTYNALAVSAVLEGMKVITDRSLSLCGDNFAEFLLRAPGAYAYLGTGNPALPNTLCSIHNGDFDVDERALLLGTGLYVEYALAVLAGNT